MRPIIFRGKANNKEEWVYGQLIIALEQYFKTDKRCNGYYIGRSDLKVTKVLETSIGQYTGLNALDGMPIYEGDIVLISPFDDDKLIGEVIYEDGCFLLDGVEGNDILCNYEVTTVLGNIHDNPELIKKGGK